MSFRLWQLSEWHLVITHQGENYVACWCFDVVSWRSATPTAWFGMSIGNSGCAECCRDQRMLGGQQNLGRFGSSQSSHHLPLLLCSVLADFDFSISVAWWRRVGLRAGFHNDGIDILVRNAGRVVFSRARVQGRIRGVVSVPCHTRLQFWIG
jgi:hypothetical protein